MVNGDSSRVGGQKPSSEIQGQNPGRGSEIEVSEAGDLLQSILQLECGPMPNLMVALPNVAGALCSTPQSLADAHY